MSIVGRAIVGAWIRQCHRTGDTARTISNDKVRSRRLMTGTTLAGGLALASIAAGPAAAADLGIIHDRDGDGDDSGKGKHNCNLIGAVINSGTTNNCIRIGTLNNSGAGAVVTN